MSDIHLLRTFLAVYRAGTFTRAARELSLTQPAVSVHIRALETQVGKPLFRREPRGVTPTNAGRELARAVAPHVDALIGALDTTSGATDVVGESMHIGGPEDFLSMRVLPELAPFMEDGMRVRMVFDVDAPVLERLQAGELDLAVVTADPQLRGVESQPLCLEYFDLVGTPDWGERLADLGEGPAGAELLADVPIAAYDEDLPIVQFYWQTVFETRATMRASLVATSLRTALHYARIGAGITVLPEHTAADSLQRGELVRLLRPTQPPRSRIYLAWRSGTLRRALLARVHDRISAAARNW